MRVHIFKGSSAEKVPGAEVCLSKNVGAPGDGEGEKNTFREILDILCSFFETEGFISFPLPFIEVREAIFLDGFIEKVDNDSGDKSDPKIAPFAPVIVFKSRL